MKIFDEISIQEEQNLVEQTLVDTANVILVNTPGFKVKPPYLHGELEQTVYSYPTNGLAGLL